MCQSHTGRLTGLWFLPKPALGLNTNDDDDLIGSSYKFDTVLGIAYSQILQCCYFVLSRSGAVGWGTAVQPGKPLVWFPFVSLGGFHWLNPLAPNDVYIRRTAQLTSRRCILNIYSTYILTEYFKNAAHSPFFSSRCRLFHNATFFGSCNIHILNTGCAKILKKIPALKC